MLAACEEFGYLEVGLLFKGLDLAHSDEQLFLHHYLMDQLSEVNYSCLSLQCSSAIDDGKGCWIP